MKMTLFSLKVKDFFGKCEQMRSFLQRDNIEIIEKPIRKLNFCAVNQVKALRRKSFRFLNSKDYLYRSL